MAPIIPPSIIAVIYAWMADESVAAMFAAGVIPGILVGIGMAVPVFVIAKKRNYPKEAPPTLPQFTAALVNALPALLIPVIIMGGILFGVFTPTEAAAVAVVYALVVPPIFYREPALRELPAIFAESARLSGVIGLIIGFVGAFGWVLTYSKFPFVVATAIAAIAPEWWMFIVLVIFLYVILGTFLTPSEIILVTVPVLLPVAQAVGVHPIHFGLVCVVASAIGHITPPVGLCLFVGMSISGLPMEKLMKPLLPFLAAIIVVLLILAFLPGCRAVPAARARIYAVGRDQSTSSFSSLMISSASSLSGFASRSGSLNGAICRALAQQVDAGVDAFGLLDRDAVAVARADEILDQRGAVGIDADRLQRLASELVGGLERLAQLVVDVLGQQLQRVAAVVGARENLRAGKLRLGEIDDAVAVLLLVDADRDQPRLLERRPRAARRAACRRRNRP